MKTKILLIEDNPDVRENTAELLELSGYEVDTAQNGKEGVNKAQKNHYDLIICDIMMPELDGYGVLHILSKNPETAHIPFIFLTAKAEKEEIRKGLSLGADDYLTKPFTETDLLNTIELRLKRKQQFAAHANPTAESLNNLYHKAKTLLDIKELSEHKKNKHYGEKQEIFNEGEKAHFVYFINKGKVKITKIDEYGKELILEILYPGDFFGYLSIVNGEHYLENAVALEETELVLIPKQDFLTFLLKDRDLSSSFIKMICRESVEKEKKLLEFAYSPVIERTANTLLKLAEKNPVISFSREELAEMVGTAKESLIRTLSQLKKDNAIEVEGKDIFIKDLQKLKSYASLK
ncbi:MAG: response regulator [Bacteroidetes bacterium]|nr:MAG: response regulator [Bacteroidota bacterium]